jgi:DNA-binding LytR/AlgR family response regulator
VNCIIIEDQSPAQRILKSYIKDVPDLHLQATFSSALEAMNYLKSHQVDLIFLDIHLPKLSGIEFIKSLQSPPQIILTTAFSDYAMEGYDLNVVDYLLKPFSFQRFFQAVGKAKERLSGIVAAPSLEEDLFIKSGYDFVKVKIKDIRFIKSDSDYTEIHTATGKCISTEPLKYWVARFENLPFVQVHKSYVIHLTHIVKVSGNTIHFDHGAQVPIGRAYKEDFLKNHLSG